MKNVAIIGLGYVGLPLALLAARKGHKVTGVDTYEPKLKLLQARKSPIEDSAVQKELLQTTVKFTSDFEEVAKADIVAVCVPTPVDRDKMPDLTILRTAVESVAKHIEPGKLLIIESTINPGVCDEVVIPALENTSGLKVGKDVYVAHCPERVNPGDPNWTVENISRVIGADSPAGLQKAVEFYESILDSDIKQMATLKEAEAVKIIENSFRDVNIAFVNELAKSFHKMGINLENVIEGAATKPFAFMPHHPGCGVGGHCIPVDPYYLIEHAKGYGFDHKFLQVAREINESMPDFTISLLDEAMEKKNLDKKSAAVVVLGQAYKPDVDDCRESPAITIYKHLESAGYNVSRHEPFAPDKSDFKSLEAALEGAQAVIIATGHSVYKKLTPKDFKNNSISIVIDGRNIYRSRIGEFKENNIYYTGIGVN